MKMHDLVWWFSYWKAHETSEFPIATFDDTRGYWWMYYDVSWWIGSVMAEFKRDMEPMFYGGCMAQSKYFVSFPMNKMVVIFHNVSWTIVKGPTYFIFFKGGVLFAIVNWNILASN